MGFLHSSGRRALRKLGLLLVILALAVQASCGAGAWNKAGDDAERDITTGIIVAVVFIGLVVLAISEADNEQAVNTEKRDCIVTSDVDLPLEMFIDGKPVGLLEPGGSLEVALQQGSHDLRWYPEGERDVDLYVAQTLEVGSEPGHYELTLQLAPAR